jgi:hypothetical protein
MNKIATFLKRYKKTSIFFGILFISYMAYAMPFKATDPSSPLFIESLFRLRDYGSDAGAVELRDKVLPKLFPVGTSKEYVDLMLVDRGGAKEDNHTTIFQGAYFYRFSPFYLIPTPDSFIIRVYYDQNNKVAAVHFAGKYASGNGYKPKAAPHIKSSE